MRVAGAVRAVRVLRHVHMHRDCCMVVVLVARNIVKMVVIKSHVGEHVVDEEVYEEV